MHNEQIAGKIQKPYIFQETCSAALCRSSSRSQRDWDGAGSNEDSDIPPADIFSNGLVLKIEKRFVLSDGLLLDDKQALRNIFVEVGLGGPLAPRFVFLQVVFTGDSCVGTRLCF